MDYPGDFPSLAASRKKKDPYHRIRVVEDALATSIGDYRLLPYIQLHEFEALLFADVARFDWEFIDHDKAIENLQDVRRQFTSPEHINYGQMTAPSKRIIAEIPEYYGRKTSAGPLIAAKIGLEVLRQQCPHFGEWLGKLEALSVNTARPET
jgi:hypothetical protein